MKLLGFMNGWRDAPHCWPYHLIGLPWVRKYRRGVFVVTAFGFVWFVEVGR